MSNRSILIVGVLGASLALFARRPEPGTPTLAEFVTNGSIDFGTAYETNRLIWIGRLHNPTADSVRVELQKASCACTGFSPSELTLAPHGEAEVRLQLKLTRRVGEFYSHIDAVLHTPGGSAPDKLIVTGVVLASPIQIDPPRVGFERIEGAMPPDDAVALQLSSTVAVSDWRIASSPEWLDARLQPEVDGRRQLTVRLHAAPPPGRHSGALLVQCVTSSGQELSTPIPAACVVRRAVEPLPELVVLGVRDVDSEVRETIRFRTPGGRLFRVEPPPEGAAPSELRAVVESTDAGPLVRVTGRIAGAGQRTESLPLEIVMLDTDQRWTVNVPVIYSGRKPQAQGKTP